MNGDLKFFGSRASHHHAEFINFLIAKFNYKSYLEIGVFQGHTWNQVQCEKKHGIDPNAAWAAMEFVSDWLGQSFVAEVPHNFANFHITSDEFFLLLKDEFKYDLIYVDGDHTYDVSKRDVLNSIDHLSENGIIVVDDVNPPDGEEEELEPWKPWIELRCERDDLSMATVKTGLSSWPCLGIIKFGSQEKLDKSKIDEYFSIEYFRKNKKMLLNMLDYEQLNNFLSGE